MDSNVQLGDLKGTGNTRSKLKKCMFKIKTCTNKNTRWLLYGMRVYVHNLGIGTRMYYMYTRIGPCSVVHDALHTTSAIEHTNLVGHSPYTRGA